jgi:ABC-type transport system substrate-binding protein
MVPDTAAAAAALRTKTTDYVSTISDQATVQQLLKSNPDITVQNELTFTPVLVYMNQGQKPFDDLRVRQAVAYAIDRKNMMKSLRPGGLISGPATPKLFGALSPEEAEKLQPYDPDKAKQLLTEAGYPNGFSTKLLVTNGYSDTVVRESQWVQQDLAKVGIKAEIDMQDYATYFTKSFAGKRYAIGAGLQTPWLTADDYLVSMWHSKGPRNWFNINDPKLDKMIEEQRSILDPAKRKVALKEVQRYILANVANPYILYIYESIVLNGSYVHDSYPAAEYGSRHFKDIWLGPEAPGRK